MSSIIYCEFYYHVDATFSLNKFQKHVVKENRGNNFRLRDDAKKVCNVSLGLNLAEIDPTEIEWSISHYSSCESQIDSW